MKKTFKTDKRKFHPKRGEIYYADLDPRYGSEQSGTRPVVVLQNNIINSLFKSTIVAPLSSGVGVLKAKDFPSNVFIEKRNGLDCDSVIKLSQIMVLDAEVRFKKFLLKLTDREMDEIEKAINFTISLGEKCKKCGNILEEKKLVCKKCHEIVKKECEECGSILDLEWTYCPSCGRRYR